MTKGLVQLVFAVLSLIASVYCMLWILSSLSLAPAGCYGNFSFFHSEMRCRQPYIAVILWIAVTMASIMLTVAGYESLKKKKPPRGSG